jgi:hypothetical protein
VDKTGLKIATRQQRTTGGRPEGPPSVAIQYLLADRRREEHRGQWGYGAGGPIVYVEGPSIVQITRCDLGKRFLVNLEDCEYESGPVPKLPRWRATLQKVLGKLHPPAPPRPPSILIETTTLDTGERRQLFGHEAHHTVTTRKQMSLNGGGSEPQETITDGWYIDLDTSIACDLSRMVRHARVHSYLAIAVHTGKRRRIEVPVAAFKDVGTPETGYAISETRVTRSFSVLPDGTRTESGLTWETEVTELTEQVLDPALFEIPSSFKRVRQIRQQPPPPLFIEP